MFVQIDRRALILKNGGQKSFSYGTKASMSFIPIKRMSLWFPIMKRKKNIMGIHVYPIFRLTLFLRKVVEGEAFLMKPMHQCHLSQ